jgi:hypothetical protein
MTFTDYEGQERTEDFYFNFTKAELSEMEFTWPGGLAKFYEKIVAEQDPVQLVSHFKILILKAYGEKSLDGRRFMKSPEISQAFSETEAYSDLFMELSNNADSAAAFCNGIIPNIPDPALASQLKMAT